jgi:hypothetical protein
VNSQFSCFPPCFPLLSHCFPPRGALLSSRASRCCCRKWTMSGLGGRRDVAECSRALGAAPVRGADCQWLCGGCFRAHGSWPAGWPCAADGVGAQRAGALADSLLWCGTACAVLGCKANRHFMLFGSGLGDVPAAVSAAAEIWHTVCSWCAALMTLVDANLCHDQRTSSPPTGHTVQVYTFYCGSVQAWRALPLLKVWPSAYTFSIWLLKVSRLVHTVTENNSRMHAP